MSINYEPTQWHNGKTVLRASHLEKIEKGITDIINYNNSIYTDEDIRKENEIKREEEHNKKLEEINSSIKDIQTDYDSLQKVIIDENASANLQNQINNVNSQLAQKANKNEVFSMANMGQDVKEAMTGGSVAVVGKNAILTENIVDGQVTSSKRTLIGSTFQLSLGNTNKAPNYNTSEGTITIYADTLIYYGTSYWATTEDIVINLKENYVSENMRLWFNTKTKTFSTRYFRYKPEDYENCIAVCSIRQYRSPYLFDCPFRFTVDEVPMYPTSSEVVDYIKKYPTNNCYLYAGSSKNSYYLRVDSVARTLTFPATSNSDGGLYINGKLYPMSTKNEGVSFDITPPSNTTLGKILFEYSTKNISVVHYSNNHNESLYYMLGTVRSSDIGGGTISVNLCVPYVIDDKFNGICVTESMMNTAISSSELKNISPINIACGTSNTIIDQLPIFDAEKLTLTLPSGKFSPAGWFFNGKFKENVLYNQSVVLDLSKTISSSLGKILVKPSTMTTSNFEYTIINWNAEFDPSEYIMIGSIRYGTPNGLSLFCPFMQNGKLYGLDYVTSSEVVGLLYQNNKDSMVKSVNHRGYCTVAPENTLSAYKLSKAKGYSYVECDVRFTSDGVPVLLHDDTIDRTSNGTGKISEMTFEEVRALDFGSWKSSDYEGEQIPTLQEFLMLCKKLDLHPYIELKAQYNGSYQLIYDTIKKAGMAKQCTILGGGKATVEALPYARVGIVTSSITSSYINTAVTYLNGHNEVFFDFQNGKVDKAICEEVLMNDIGLEVWHVFTKDDVHLNVELGVTGITNDSLNIAEMLQK